MNLDQLKKSIEDVEKSLEISRKNKETAEYHIEEGELVLNAFKVKLIELEKEAAK